MSIRSLAQEDPIGVAGGLNLYGFAGGDPVNGADASGLEGDLRVRCSVADAASWSPDGVTWYPLDPPWVCYYSTLASSESRAAGLIAATNPYSATWFDYQGVSEGGRGTVFVSAGVDAQTPTQHQDEGCSLSGVLRDVGAMLGGAGAFTAETVSSTLTRCVFTPAKAWW